LESDLIAALIDAIKDVFVNLGHKLDLTTNIMVFNSHGPDKRSIHIIIDGFMFGSSRATKKVAKMCINQLDNKYQAHIDLQIFDKNHPLRIYACLKYGTNRVKRWSSTWNYHGTEITTKLRSDAVGEYAILEGSLISWNSNCLIIPIQLEEPKPVIPIDIDSGLVKRAMTLLAEIDPHHAFEFAKLNGNSLELTRKSPSHCDICHRIHHKQNPFIVFKPTGIWFSCRQAQNGEMKLLSDEKLDSISEPNMNEPKIERSPYYQIEQRLEKLAGRPI
jgi:hypothetical protein